MTIQAAPPSLIYLVAMPSYTYHTCSAALQPMLPPIHLVMPVCFCTTTSTTTIMRVPGHPGRTTIVDIPRSYAILHISHMQHSPLAHAASHPPRHACLLLHHHLNHHHHGVPGHPGRSIVVDISRSYAILHISHMQHSPPAHAAPIHLVMPACSCTTTSTTTIMRVPGHPGRTTIADISRSYAILHISHTAAQPSSPCCSIHLVMPACSCTTTSTTTIMRVHDHPGRTTIADISRSYAILHISHMPHPPAHAASIHLVMPACSCTTTSTTTIMRVPDHPGRTTIADISRSYAILHISHMQHSPPAHAASHPPRHACLLLHHHLNHHRHACP